MVATEPAPSVAAPRNRTARRRFTAGPARAMSPFSRAVIRPRCRTAPGAANSQPASAAAMAMPSMP